MNASARWTVRFSVVALAAAAALAGCRGGTDSATSRDDGLARYHGKVLVLLMGMPGCPGTEAGTKFLAGYRQSAPADVAVLRVDVPPPGGQLAEPAAAVPIEREMDRERKLAGQLEFFFYPTLYVLDRDGAVRFAGGCEPDRVKEIVAALLAEKPGAPKTSFSPPLPAIGSPAPNFAGRSPAGADLGLAQLRGVKGTLLFFGATSCPFSNQYMAAMPAFVKDYAARGLAVAIVTHSPADEKTGRLHGEKAPGVPVVCDPEDRIGRGQYRVPAVPFYFLLDGDGKVAACKPFTEAAARAEIDKLLGAAPGCGTGPASTGAG